jgi:nucleoside-triphosphatase
MDYFLKNLLLTGKPGVGKTTLLERVVKSLNVPVGGFYTQEIREDGVRKGFQLITWDGKSGVLSHVNIQSPRRVGKYGVDVKILEEIGIPAIEEAIKHARLIAIDELARMELYSQAFQKTVLNAMDSKVPVVATIQERAYPFLDKVRQRSDVQLLAVTLENRDSLVGILSEKISELISY